MERYAPTKMLAGKGSYATAWVAVDRLTGVKCILKEMRAFTPEDLRDAESESQILARLDHPNIIKCRSVVMKRRRSMHAGTKTCSGRRQSPSRL